MLSPGARLENSRSAVDRPARPQGQAHDDEHVVAPGGLSDPLQALERRVQQVALVIQVPAGSAGYRKLGEREKLHALFPRLFDALHYLLRVKLRVRHTQFRRGGSNFDKTVFHSITLYPCL